MSAELFEVIFGLVIMIAGPLVEYLARRRRLQQMEVEDAHEPLPPSSTQPVNVEPWLGQAQLAAHLQRFLEDVYGPFVEFFETYSIGSHWPLSPDLHASLAKRVHADPRRWALLAQDAGSMIYRAVPSLREQTQNLASFNELTWEPELIEWLDELFPDILATLWLGPAYTTALLAQAAAHRPSRRRTAPMQARFEASTKVLDEIGRHREAKKLRTRWNEQLLSSDKSVDVDDRAPTPVETLVKSLLLYPFPALAEHTLLDIPGVTYAHVTHSHVLRALEEYSINSSAKAAPREIVAAAILVNDREPLMRQQLVEWAKRSILRKLSADAVRSGSPARIKHASLKAALYVTLDNPQEMAKVLAIGAILPRRRGIRHSMPRGN